MKVWAVIDFELEAGSESIKGLFDSEEKAKLFIADYVLKNEVNSEYLELVKKKIEVSVK
ncbi:hypothetical protein [Oceanobacillus profundus]|uniref:hypothetical protein n=1 Tax=Oceanobacillus TaxID=182709 RepID=UPI0026E36AC5|nr:hypothetical protein [Oceanobacillus profundus]MDO6448118.1 hypothetical protein [Oceanobacillus profundus]